MLYWLYCPAVRCFVHCYICNKGNPVLIVVALATDSFLPFTSVPWTNTKRVAICSTLPEIAWGFTPVCDSALVQKRCLKRLIRWEAGLWEGEGPRVC